MSRYKLFLLAMAIAVIMQAGAGFAQEKKEMPVTSDRPGHQESAREHQGSLPFYIQTPPLPEGMSLDEVLMRPIRRLTIFLPPFTMTAYMCLHCLKNSNTGLQMMMTPRITSAGKPRDGMVPTSISLVET